MTPHCPVGIPKMMFLEFPGSVSWLAFHLYISYIHFIYIYIYVCGWRTSHFMGRFNANMLLFFPSFIANSAQNLQPPKGGCKLFFSFLVFLFFCLFLSHFSFFLCFYKSQSLKIAHQLRCAAHIYIYIMYPLLKKHCLRN